MNFELKQKNIENPSQELLDNESYERFLAFPRAFHNSQENISN